MAADTKSQHRWRDRDIDNDLMFEVTSPAPSEARIRELVERGADVNSPSSLGSLLMDALFFNNEGPREHVIHLLVELGADVNYLSAEGVCALYDAAYFATPALVEYLLQRGANPNSVDDEGDTVLDRVESDLSYNQMQGPSSVFHFEQRVRKLEEVVPILRRHGAKRLEELHAEHVSRWLRVFGCWETGLMTSGGNIEVEAIAGLTDAFRSDFNAWKQAFWDSWPDDWSSKPAQFDRGEHNAWGRRLSKVIRAALPSEIRVNYMTLNAEDERKNIRTVDWETIAD